MTRPLYVPVASNFVPISSHAVRHASRFLYSFKEPSNSIGRSVISSIKRSFFKCPRVVRHNWNIIMSCIVTRDVMARDQMLRRHWSKAKNFAKHFVDLEHAQVWKSFRNLIATTLFRQLDRIHQKIICDKRFKFIQLLRTGELQKFFNFL